MGGALGLAILASLAASRTNHLLEVGTPHLSALVGGYRVAFVIGAAFAALAATLSAQMLRAAPARATSARATSARATEPAGETSGKAGGARSSKGALADA
jgi:hypothetical protein